MHMICYMWSPGVSVTISLVCVDIFYIKQDYHRFFLGYKWSSHALHITAPAGDIASDDATPSTSTVLYAMSTSSIYRANKHTFCYWLISFKMLSLMWYRITVCLLDECCVIWPWSYPKNTDYSVVDRYRFMYHHIHVVYVTTLTYVFFGRYA